MTIIEALLFILFTFVLVYFWILIMGLATMVTQQEEEMILENIAILCRLCHREQGFHWPDGDDHGLLVSKDWLEANRAISDRRSQQGITWRDTPAYKPA